jgi:5-formyltetrahydrofolate cyclo-ligase
MMKDQLDVKRSLRAKMNETRQSLTTQERNAVSERICRHLYAFIESRMDRGSGVVMTYMPFREEADVYSLTEQLWMHGYTVAVPRVNPEDKQLDVRIVHGLADLETGAWGIREPNPSTTEAAALDAIAIVLVPGLAYDPAGGRLGYGGGFYDRFFERFERAGLQMPMKMGVCYNRQMIEHVPMESHDYAVDAVVTEQGIVLASSKSS